MSQYSITGRCLCKKVSYAITSHLGIFQYCHCSQCRTFTGSAFAANLLVAPTNFYWLNGEEWVGRYEVADARHFATSFCKNCGSALPWLGKSGKAVVIPAGSLDDDPQIRPSQNIFCGSRAVWYREPSALPEYDELPPKRQ